MILSKNLPPGKEKLREKIAGMKKNILLVF